MGGSRLFNMGSFYNSAWRIDPERNAWTQIADMHTARAASAAAALNGSIYVSGGFTFAGDRLKSVERYDPGTNTWTEAAPLNVARDRHRMLTLGGKLYAIGGIGASATPGELN